MSILGLNGHLPSGWSVEKYKREFSYLLPDSVTEDTKKELIRLLDIYDLGRVHTYYVTYEGMTVAFFGINPYWQGVAELWTFILDPAPLIRFKKSFHRCANIILDYFIAEHNLHRLQATVLQRFYKGRKWIVRLGFHDEGLMEAYGPNGENHIRYARIEQCRA